MAVSSRALLQDSRVVGMDLLVYVQEGRPWDMGMGILRLEDSEGHYASLRLDEVLVLAVMVTVYFEVIWEMIALLAIRSRQRDAVINS
jgi:hypothetical protein